MGDSSVGTSDITFSGLRSAWGNAGYSGGTDPGSTNIQLSEFRGANFTDGTTVPNSGEISINDDFKGKTFGSSGGSNTDISSSFYEISNRFIADYSSSDYTGAYDVGQVQFSFSGTNGRVYIGIKTTASPTYYNDIAVAAVQHLNSSGTVQNTWIFHSSSGGSGSSWQTYTSQTSAQSSTGFPITPQTASGYSYSNISTSTGTGKFSFASSTGSSYTGAAGGISSSATSFSVGNATVSQVGSNFYAYRETSGSTRYTGAVMRGPSVSMSNGDIIKVVHLVVGHYSYQMNANDCLYVAVYEDSGGGGGPPPGGK